MDAVAQDSRLLAEIDRIVWSDEPETGKILAIQNLMYQWGANQDAKTEQMFGDDDTYPYPNTRRC